MPLPKPKKGQTEDDFIAQCMSDTKMTAEFPDRKQRFAVCSGQLRANRLDGSVEITDLGSVDLEGGCFS